MPMWRWCGFRTSRQLLVLNTYGKSISPFRQTRCLHAAQPCCGCVEYGPFTLKRCPELLLHFKPWPHHRELVWSGWGPRCGCQLGSDGNFISFDGTGSLALVSCSKEPNFSLPCFSFSQFKWSLLVFHVKTDALYDRKHTKSQLWASLAIWNSRFFLSWGVLQPILLKKWWKKACLSSLRFCSHRSNWIIGPFTNATKLQLGQGRRRPTPHHYSWDEVGADQRQPDVWRDVLVDVLLSYKSNFRGCFYNSAQLGIGQLQGSREELRWR